MKNFQILFTLLFSLFAVYYLSSSYHAEAHFSHLAHYNTGGMGFNKYYINQQVDPEYTKPNQLSQLQFSIWDRNSHDVHNIVVMVEVYAADTGERISVFPWTKLATGDFQVPFIFPKKGNYQIVASILNDGVNSSNILNTIPPPRDILNSNLGCNCDRGVFNVTVSQTFGFIFESVIYMSVFSSVGIIGGALFLMYLSRRKSKIFKPISNNDFIKYSVLLLALGASIVHLAVYAEHGGLRLEYSIFLLAASGGQLLYGVLYILLMFADEQISIKKTDKNLISRKYYNQTLALNLIGLIGSLILIFLYAYSVIFAPPLSPNRGPEDVDIAGVIDKSLEVVLVIGIVYLMRSERKRYVYSKSLV